MILTITKCGKIAAALICTLMLSGSLFALANDAEQKEKNPAAINTQLTAPKTAVELLSPLVKISFEQAEKIAQHQAPGRTNEIELEREKSGTLVYSVEIYQDGKEIEIKIDAISGETIKTEEKNKKVEKKDKKDKQKKTQKSSSNDD